MRPILLPFITLFFMAAQSQAIEWDTFSINENPVPASALVSFSIGYPKGWTVFEDPSLQRADIYFDVPIGPGHGLICSFTHAVSTNEPDLSTCMISRTDVVTAKEAAENFLPDMRKLYGNGSLSAVKTDAGDSGWLVESKGCVVFFPAWLANDPAWPASKNVVSDLPRMEQDPRPSVKVPVIFDNFFFRSESPGNKAGIQIQIMTNADDPSRRAELEQLILQTLRFNNS